VLSRKAIVIPVASTQFRADLRGRCLTPLARSNNVTLLAGNSARGRLPSVRPSSCNGPRVHSVAHDVIQRRERRSARARASRAAAISATLGDS
jgi:hypothetical protein